MPLINNYCRCCGSSDLTLLPIGQYANFFAKRIDVRKDPFLLFTSQYVFFNVPTYGGGALGTFLSRVHKKLLKTYYQVSNKGLLSFRTLAQFCNNCSTLAPKFEWSYEDLGNFYHDYRSDTYNRERISVEPTYAAFKDRVGIDPLEVEARYKSLDEFLSGHLTRLPKGFIALDYGGSDGRFVPPSVLSACSKVDIYDASSAPLHSSVDVTKVTKVKSVEGKQYSFLMCMHVLEHVGNPREFVEQSLRHLEPGGLMYVEVPLELSDEFKRQCASNMVRIPFQIHEHLNQFDFVSIRKLIGTFKNLSLVDARDTQIDIGWIVGRIGCYLIQKDRDHP